MKIRVPFDVIEPQPTVPYGRQGCSLSRVVLRGGDRAILAAPLGIQEPRSVFVQKKPSLCPWAAPQISTDEGVLEVPGRDDTEAAPGYRPALGLPAQRGGGKDGVEAYAGRT